MYLVKVALEVTIGKQDIYLEMYIHGSGISCFIQWSPIDGRPTQRATVCFCQASDIV